MVSAAAGADASYLNKDLDQTTYHRSAFVDHILCSTFGGTYNTFDLAIPGQMPSDAYMAFRAGLGAGLKPKVVIYGVAPRDFIDSTLHSPLDTESYHYLSRLVALDTVAPELFRDPVVRFNRTLEKSVFLYGHSLDFQIAAADRMQQLIDVAVPRPWSSQPFTYWDRQKLFPNYKKTELYPTAMIASPLEQKFKLSRFTDNTKDYIDRYRHQRADIYRIEFFFLEKLAALCHQNKIDLVLVNMPVTKKNVSILTDQRYRDYLADLSRFGQSSAVPVLDLNDFNQYTILDFHDLVHLNGCGAQKFFSSLGQSLSQDGTTAQMLRRAGRVTGN
jgi:hypothetical protein